MKKKARSGFSVSRSAGSSIEEAAPIIVPEDAAPSEPAVEPEPEPELEVEPEPAVEIRGVGAVSSDSGASGTEALLGLFLAELPTVRFPGIDAGVLSNAEERVQSARAELKACEAALEAAVASLREAEEDQLVKSQRALAYLRIYADEAPELLPRVAGITLGKKGRRGDVDPAAAAPLAPRRRNRIPKP